MVDCIFCKIGRGQLKSEIIAETAHFFAIRDIKPKVPGHTLIISKQHYATLLDIPNDYGNELLSFVRNVAEDLRRSKLGKGFNVLMNNFEVAGQVVMHAHVHIVPRNENDGVRPLA